MTSQHLSRLLSSDDLDQSARKAWKHMRRRHMMSQNAEPTHAANSEAVAGGLLPGANRDATGSQASRLATLNCRGRCTNACARPASGRITLTGSLIGRHQTASTPLNCSFSGAVNQRVRYLDATDILAVSSTGVAGDPSAYGYPEMCCEFSLPRGRG